MIVISFYCDIQTGALLYCLTRAILLLKNRCIEILSGGALPSSELQWIDKYDKMPGVAFPNMDPAWIPSMDK